MIFVPADSQNAPSVEMVSIDPRDLQEAQDRDAEANAGCQAAGQLGMTREKD
jgi:hypothetical protein